MNFFNFNFKKRKASHSDASANDLTTNTPLAWGSSDNSTNPVDTTSVPNRRQLIENSNNDAGFDRIVELFQHWLRRRGHGAITLEDSRHWQVFRPYPPRQVTNSIKFIVTLGVREIGGIQMVDGCIQLDAEGLDRPSRVIKAVEEEQWRDRLEHRYPSHFEPRLVRVYVRYSEGLPNPSKAVEADEVVYGEWFDDHVCCGRDSIYYVDLIYDRRDGALPNLPESSV